CTSSALSMPFLSRIATSRASAAVAGASSVESRSSASECGSWVAGVSGRRFCWAVASTSEISSHNRRGWLDAARDPRRPRSANEGHQEWTQGRQADRLLPGTPSRYQETCDNDMGKPGPKEKHRRPPELPDWPARRVVSADRGVAGTGDLWCRRLTCPGD